MRPANVRSLFEQLEQFSDPRGRQGRRHPLPAMLTTVICAMLCGARGFRSIAQWLRIQDTKTWHWLGFKRSPPCANCFADLLKAISPEEFEEVVRRWTSGLQGIRIDPELLSAVSIDGKTLCGTLQAHKRALHLLSALDHQTGYVLSQTQVDPKTNEAKAALNFLKSLVLQGRVIVGDAMFCQKEICRQIIDSGGDYLFVVKENQPTLLKEIQLAFADAKSFSPWQQHQLHDARQRAFTQGKGHGRIEYRELTSSVLLKEHLDWPGVQQVCQLRRTTMRGGRRTTDIQYAITSVDRARADAAQLLKWWRGHWGIENKVHWVRDETFGEDRCRVRTLSAPQVLGGVRNLIMNWFRSQKIDTIAQALRENAWNPQPLFAKLGKPNF